MEDKKIENGIKSLKNLKMTPEEKNSMLESILERDFERKEKMPEKSPYFSFFGFSTRKAALYSVLVLLVIIFGSSEIYLAGEKNVTKVAQMPSATSGRYSADRTDQNNSAEQKPSFEMNDPGLQSPPPVQSGGLPSDMGTSTRQTESLNSVMLGAPAVSDSQKTERYIDIANKLFENWLREKSKENPLLDYKIDKILFIADKATAKENEAEWFNKGDTRDAFMVEIGYSVKPTPENTLYWSAGNGKIGEDGWILNKSLFMKVDLRESGYFIKSLGTGP